MRFYFIEKLQINGITKINQHFDNELVVKVFVWTKSNGICANHAQVKKRTDYFD